MRMRFSPLSQISSQFLPILSRYPQFPPNFTPLSPVSPIIQNFPHFFPVFLHYSQFSLIPSFSPLCPIFHNSPMTPISTHSHSLPHFLSLFPILSIVLSFYPLFPQLSTITPYSPHRSPFSAFASIFLSNFPRFSPISFIPNVPMLPPQALSLLPSRRPRPSLGPLLFPPSALEPISAERGAPRTNPSEARENSSAPPTPGAQRPPARAGAGPAHRRVSGAALRQAGNGE